jgi:hypothetical protein
MVALTERDDARERQDALTREAHDVQKRIAPLVDIIAEGGGDSVALVGKLRQVEERHRSIGGEIEALQPLPRLAPAEVEDRLAEWRRLLHQSTTQARAVLQRVLDGRLTVAPRPRATASTSQHLRGSTSCSQVRRCKCPRGWLTIWRRIRSPSSHSIGVRRSTRIMAGCSNVLATVKGVRPHRDSAKLTRREAGRREPEDRWRR